MTFGFPRVLIVALTVFFSLHIPGLPCETAKAIQQTMAKEPAERFQTAGDFIRAFQ